MYTQGKIVGIKGTEKIGLVYEDINQETSQIKIRIYFDGMLFCGQSEVEDYDIECVEMIHIDNDDIRKGYLEYEADIKFRTYWTRKEDRIVFIIRSIEECWREYPYFRLGQLISRLSRLESVGSIEDNILIENLFRGRCDVFETK